MGRHPPACNHTVLSWLLPTSAEPQQNKRIWVQNVKALLSLLLSHEVLQEKGTDCVKDELKLGLHCHALHTKNSSQCDNTERVWLEFKSSKQSTCEMQWKHTGKFTGNHGFFTPELLKTIQQLAPVLQPSLSSRRTGLAPSLLVGSELSLHISAQQWGFGPAHATLWCCCNTGHTTEVTVSEFFLLKALIQILQITVDTMQNRIMALARKKSILQGIFCSLTPLGKQ